MTSRDRLSVFTLVALTIGMYAVGLGRSPVYMHDAEVLFALHERSIAATLRDTNGTFLPLYFHMPAIGANVWFHPMIVYWSAIFLKFLPFAEWSVRLPSAIVGAVDVGLVYLVATHVFRDRRYAWLAAALLALTPAHFIHSRLAMDYVYPVPFVLVWLWCLLEFDESERPAWIWGAGFALGIGFYSYIAAVAFMPSYLVFTWLYLLAKYRRPQVAHLIVTAA
ncbi:MAG TPA: glycosyltransferase family 39 protein, partial [Vicinamibacterales bacterium]|nr:glycosyltransferase family 39 protein [Vicinamibacterales bacterium]